MLTVTIGALAIAAAIPAESKTVGPWTVDAGGAPRLVLRCHTWSEAGKWFGKHKDRDVYLYSGSAFDAEEGDVMVTFEGEAQPKKWWGAPSEDRHSFFIRGTGLTGRSTSSSAG